MCSCPGLFKSKNIVDATGMLSAEIGAADVEWHPVGAVVAIVWPGVGCHPVYCCEVDFKSVCTGVEMGSKTAWFDALSETVAWCGLASKSTASHFLIAMYMSLSASVDIGTESVAVDALLVRSNSGALAGVGDPPELAISSVWCCYGS